MKALFATRISRLLSPLCLAVGACASATVASAQTSVNPQVLLVIPNSQSVDGTTSGAVMTGSGTLPGAGTLTSSSSPVAFQVPAGFVPPVDTGSGGAAPQTAPCPANASLLCDNGPSRLNLAKNAIQLALNQYGSAIQFGLVTYATDSPAIYSTWVYHMSPPGGFAFANSVPAKYPPGVAKYVPNPCYAYASSPNSTVRSNCASVAGHYSASTVPGGIGAYAYLGVAASSDDPAINDVLYWTGSNYVFLAFGQVVPASPYAAYGLSSYKSGSITVGYSRVLPPGGVTVTGPTNAGYVPFTTEVLYARRGFGYYANPATTTSTNGAGKLVASMGTSPSGFSAALAPETNSASTSEVKALAVQSPMGALLNYANKYLGGLTLGNTCQHQYVVMITDGLPTQDNSGYKWPPLGSAAAAGYGVSANFQPGGALGSSNDQALTDAIAAIARLYNGGATTSTRRSVKVFVIGLGAGVDPSVNPAAAATLKAMAIAGGTTNYYPANSAQELNNAFLAIVDTIYHETSVSAPIAPITVSGGLAYEYELTTNPAPLQGDAKAFKVASDGTPSQTATWDAAMSPLMTPASRAASLMSTDSAGNLRLLANFTSTADKALFQLTAPSNCVPDVATIVSYTIDPNYTPSPNPYNCTYLNGRAAAVANGGGGGYLNGFTTQSMGTYVGPPGSSALLSVPGYTAYAASVKSRTPMLVFTNGDGFLYGVNAQTGSLMWGWMPPSGLSLLKSAAPNPVMHLLDGGFRVVDARDGAGKWGSYVVGSAQSGAEHFSLRLDAGGTPSAVVYDRVVAGGTAPGDLAASVGANPLHQYPQVFYVGGTAYAVYVVNTGTTTVTSTLYEVDVATGASTSAVIGASRAFHLTSALNLVQANGQLWMGDAAGNVWVTYLTGNATADVASANPVATLVNPATNAAMPVLYVGLTQVNGVPYLYAVGSSVVTAFGLTTSGWAPLWSSAPDQGYSYSSGAFAASGTVAPMTTGGVISDAPRLDGTLMTIPVYQAGTGTYVCGGTAYLDFFSADSGQFPTVPYTYNGAAITSHLMIGAMGLSGAAFAPSATVTQYGIALNPGSTGTYVPGAPLVGTKLKVSPSFWRQN